MPADLAVRLLLPPRPLWLALLAVVLVALGGAGCAGSAPTPAPSATPYEPGDGPVRYVIHISVDGLRPDAVVRQLGALPTFARLRDQAAFTDNARTDAVYSNTLPNHMGQLTGRAVTGPAGHGWETNRDPDTTVTLHSQRGAYVPSVFDVVHDRGLRTGLYASKSKFALFDRSYDAVDGAPDTTGADDGRDKIDVFVYERDTEDLVDRFVADMRADPHDYAFVHLRDPDTAGHWFGWRLWQWHPYMRAVRRVDDRLGEILALVESDPRLAGHTAVIVTADHGGSGHAHGSAGSGEPEDYIVPFYVWGPGVPPGDLYAVNESAFLDPGTGRPGSDAPLQPVRNGAAANLALSLLDLPPVPGSTVNREGQLQVRPAGGSPVSEPVSELGSD